MKVLIACHGSEEVNMTYSYNKNEMNAFEESYEGLSNENKEYFKYSDLTWSPKLRIISKTGKVDPIDIHYIDKDKKNIRPNEYAKWEDISDNTFDYVWAQYCPFFLNFQLAREIFEDSWRILKPGGCFITSYTKSDKNQLGNDDKKFLSMVNESNGNGFSIEDMLFDALPLQVLLDKFPTRNIPQRSYLLLTKKLDRFQPCAPLMFRHAGSECKDAKSSEYTNLLSDFYKIKNNTGGAVKKTRHRRGKRHSKKTRSIHT